MAEILHEEKPKRRVYLIPCGDRAYRAAIAEAPPESAAILLAFEGSYPVEVTWTRFDMNGDRIWTGENCENDTELIELLDFLGKCGHTVEQLWNYDDHWNTDVELAELFDVCFARKMEELDAAMADLYEF